MFLVVSLWEVLFGFWHPFLRVQSEILKFSKLVQAWNVIFHFSLSTKYVDIERVHFASTYPTNTPRVFHVERWNTRGVFLGYCVIFFMFTKLGEK